MQFLYQIHVLHIFSPSMMLASHNLNGVILKSKSFHFDKVHFIKFLCYGLCFLCPKNLCTPKVTMILSHHFFFFRSFVILDFTFRSMIHFGLNFYVSLKCYSSFFSSWTSNSWNELAYYLCQKSTGHLRVCLCVSGVHICSTHNYPYTKTTLPWIVQFFSKS